MEREQLREVLTRINSDTGRCPDTLDDTLEAMLAHIGDTDPALRDKLIYRGFCRLILSGKLTPQQLHLIVKTGLDDNHLFYKIGENGTDSVFTRSFSVLLFSLLLYRHQEDAFLTEGEIGDIYTAMIRYLSEERDYRGYVPGRGWAHAVAHTADAVDELVKIPSLPREKVMRLLAVVSDVMANSDAVFAHNEDGRMAEAVKTAFMNLPAWDKAGWIERAATVERSGRFPEDMYLLLNLRNLLTGVYFRLPEDDAARPVLEEAIRSIHTI